MRDGIPFSVWAVHRDNSDVSSGEITEICATPELAWQIASRSGYYGGDAPVEKRHVITFDGVVYLLNDKEPVVVIRSLDEARLVQQEAVKRRALAKLSDAERDVLGL